MAAPDNLNGKQFLWAKSVGGPLPQEEGVVAAKHNLGPQFADHSKVQEINAAIDSYPSHIRQESMGEMQAPYDSGSLAEIYEPRVRDLMGLQSEGFTHARWGHDPETKTNRWFGQTGPSGEQ